MFFPAWNKLVVSESAAAVLKTEEEVGIFVVLAWLDDDDDIFGVAHF